MALSGSIVTNAWSADDGTTRTYTLSWTAKQSVADNKSTITWTLKSSGSYSGNVAERTLTAVINGTTVYSKTDRVMRGVNVTIASGNVVIPHNSDGSKSFTASVSAAVYYSTVNCTGSKTFTLDKIARQSSFGAITGNTLGSSMTVNITRQVSSYTHQFWYKLGNSKWYDLGTGYGTSITFTPDINLCSQLPNATSGTLELCIRTYSGTTKIGSDVYKNVTVNVPASVMPTATVSITDAMGYLATYGAYVQGQSKFKIAVTAGGAYGSTIKSYSTTADGKTYTSASVETDVIANSGTLTVKTTVTDSRGRKAEVSQTVTVLAYTLPKISDFKVKRCDSSGSSNSSGAYLAVVFSAEITSLNNNNSAAYKVQYKKVSDSVYTEATATAYTGVYSVANGMYIFAADVASNYDIILTAQDAFASASKAGNGSAVGKVLSILKKGIGMAIGKIAEFEGVFEIAFKTRFTGGFDVIALADGTDLDTLTTPNKYGLRSNYKFVNVPFSGLAAVMEVDGIGNGSLVHRLHVLSKENPHTYERAYYNGAWGEWVCVTKDLKDKVDDLTPVIYSTNDKVNDSAPTGTATTVATLTLPAGSYILNGYVDLRGDIVASTGYRSLAFSGSGCRVKWFAPDINTNLRMDATDFCKLTAETTINLTATQTSGKSATVYAVTLKAMRIGA